MTTATELLTEYVDAQARHLGQQLVLLRGEEGEDEAVHQVRVAARRLRSILATYRDLVVRERTEPLRAELRWLGRQCAPARDQQVLRERFRALSAEQPPELLLGPVSRLIDDQLRVAYRAERRRLAGLASGPRVQTVLTALQDLVESPPVDAAGATPASSVTPAMLRRDLERVRRRFAASEHAEDRETALHDVRKAAKRLRYAAEGAAPVLGDRSAGLAAVAEQLQDALGEHQDARLAQETLREIGARARLDGEDARSLGRLQALEEARAADAERRGAAIYAQLPRPGELDRWWGG